MRYQDKVVVIGGGFYGCVTALYLNESGYQVLLIERADDLLTRASFANQARVHNGYHYPRSFMTAWRSLMNFPRFIMDFSECIDNSFEKVYAIARRNSQVSAYQFRQFCKHIGAPFHPAPVHIRDMFNPQLIEEVFVVKEFAFDAIRLREMMRRRLENTDIDVRFNTEVISISQDYNEPITVLLNDDTEVQASYVFNCTYAQINVLLQGSTLAPLRLKHQIAEIALVDVPTELKRLGITIMDGPFFSVMPFPAHQLHSLSHVRYTHHETWFDPHQQQRAPYQYLEQHLPQSNFPYMYRDAKRYLPSLEGTQHVESLFEIKTLLLRNEIDDGRPILFHQNSQIQGLFSVLGGKIDNIFDLLQNIKRFVRNV